MKSFRFGRWAAAAGALLLGAGCFKYDEEWTLLPDGSGKLRMRFSVPSDYALYGAEDAYAWMASLVEESEGISGGSEPQEEERGGWRSCALVLYFEDIGRLKLRKGKNVVQFAFGPAGEGCMLDIAERVDCKIEIAVKMGEKKREGEEPGDELKKRILRELIGGLEIHRTVVMPGPLSHVEGFPSWNGNRASEHITEKDISDDDLLKGRLLPNPRPRKLVCGQIAVPDLEHAAFRRELDAARISWGPAKERMRREAVRRWKERGEGE
ncbi:MAG: hypothetical protein HY716_12025 [Planctomycetes bacterium]|nr:hypothetical protein [Planctomycetota bacterium]